MHYDRPFNKAIVDLPIRIKGNSKLINQINKIIYTIWSQHIHTEWFFVYQIPGRTGIGKCWFSKRVRERRKPEYPEKNLSEKGREPTTNSTLFPLFVESVVGIGQQGQVLLRRRTTRCLITSATQAIVLKRTLSMLTLRVISIKFRLVISMLCKTVWS